MIVRSFGDTDLRVSEFGLGCARIGGIFQGNARAFVDLLHAARDAGITFFDTADMYSQGESEALVGRAFHRQRDRVVIASKAGYCLPAQRRLAARVKPLLRPVIRALGIRRSALPAAVRGAPTQDFSPAYLRTAVEASLRRLRTDYLDLFQLHSPPAEVVRRGDWIEALEGMKRAGKIRYYGVSCDTVDAGAEALKHPGVSALQFTISLLEQGGAEELLPAARERRAGVIARECLANGLLVKNDGEVDLSAYVHSEEQRLRRVEQLSGYRSQAAAKGITLAGLAMEYASGLPGVGVTLLGVKNLGQLEGLMRWWPERE